MSTPRGRRYYTFDGYDPSDGLKGGRWMFDDVRRVRVWVQVEPVPGEAACGTDSGYYAHRRQRREEACAGCKDAHRVAGRLRQAKARIRRLRAECDEMSEAC